MVPRLRETRPAARGDKDAGITQPREHSLADPCTLYLVGHVISSYHCIYID